MLRRVGASYLMCASAGRFAQTQTTRVAAAAPVCVPSLFSTTVLKNTLGFNHAIRGYCTPSADDDEMEPLPDLPPFKTWAEVSKEFIVIHEEFAECRLNIGDAKDSVGTTYFGDDIKDAKSSTERVLARYAQLKDNLKSTDGQEGVESGMLTRLEKEYDIKFKQLQGELDEVMAFCE